MRSAPESAPSTRTPLRGPADRGGPDQPQRGRASSSSELRDHRQVLGPARLLLAGRHALGLARRHPALHRLAGLVLDGGYKAWRRFVREELDRLATTPGLEIHILAGSPAPPRPASCHALAAAGAQILDLEGLANHRGIAPRHGRPATDPEALRIPLCTRSSPGSIPPARSSRRRSRNRIGTVHIPATLWRLLGAGTVHEVWLPIQERAAYLLEDYEHFPADPRHISHLVNALRRLRGHELVDQWQRQIKAGEWREFVRSILENHYDLAYRQPGSAGGNYQAPANAIDIPDAAPATLHAAAADLLRRCGVSP